MENKLICVEDLSKPFNESGYVVVDSTLTSKTFQYSEALVQELQNAGVPFIVLESFNEGE